VQSVGAASAIISYAHERRSSGWVVGDALPETGSDCRPGLRVLLADGNAGSRQMVALALRMDGHQVIAVEDARHLNERLELRVPDDEPRFDVIVCGDLLRGDEVPAMRALESVARARALILITNRGRLISAVAAQKLQATAIFRHPVDMPRLRRLLRLYQ